MFGVWGAALSEEGMLEYCTVELGEVGLEDDDEGPVGSTLKINSTRAPATSADARWAGR